MISNRLKNLRRTDYQPNGLAIFAGEDISSSNMVCDIVRAPTIANITINTTHYSCGKSFDLEIFKRQLSIVCNSSANAYGVVILTGNDLFIARVFGEKREKLFSKSVELPRKHGRGGQSQARFQRLRV